MPNDPARNSHPGFTLVDTLIMVMLLAVVAGLVIPMYQNRQRDAYAAALKSNLRLMNDILTYQREITGTYPETFAGSFFASGKLPDHPQADLAVPAVQTVTGDAVNPVDRVLTDGSAGAYWYNRDLGIVRARVASVGTLEETLAFYDEVNGTNLAAGAGAVRPDAQVIENDEADGNPGIGSNDTGSDQNRENQASRGNGDGQGKGQGNGKGRGDENGRGLNR